MSKARNLSLLSTVEAGATTDQTKADINALGINRGRKNMVINGGMQVAQRGTSFTGNTSGSKYTADRFKVQIGDAGTFTFDNSSTAPEGFSNSSHMNCTTAFSVASGTYLLFSQDFEGQDLQQAAYGTASAKQMTVSFWCRATKTGSLSVVIRQEDASQRMFSKNVTINTANTWEKKSVVIPADTGGTINNDSGKGLQIAWWVNGGSTYGGGSEQTTWGAQTHTNKYTGTLNIGASTADNFYLTGVQLELGSVATDFEHRSYGEELALCQRYYQRFGAPDDAQVLPFAGMCVSSSVVYFVGQTYVPMRVQPTGSSVNPSNFRVRNASNSGIPTISSLGVSAYSNTLFIATAENASGLTAGHASHLFNYNGSNYGYIQLDAEL